MTQRTILLALTLCTLAVTPASAQTRAVPPYTSISEDLSEQRRSVFVRIDRRMDEADLLAIAAQVQARAKRVYPRTQVNFALPGMPLNQGSWASVLFVPEPKVMVHGLSRADEDLFLAEHKADHRSLLGSWLTSTPAPLGRLTIYSDHGKVFAEWRLRGGQKTVDELIDTTTKTVRRFDVLGGGYFVLTRAGELEIWDKANLIAVAERIRPEHLAVPTAVASLTKLAKPTPINSAVTEQLPSSPTQPEPKQAARVGAASSAGAMALAAPSSAPMPTTATPASQQAALTQPPVTQPAPVANQTPEQHKVKPRKATQAKPKVRSTRVAAQPKSKGTTTGDEISAKLAGRF